MRFEKVTRENSQGKKCSEHRKVNLETNSSVAVSPPNYCSDLVTVQ